MGNIYLVVGHRSKPPQGGIVLNTQLMRSETKRKKETMEKQIKEVIDLSSQKKATFLCSWNGKEVVQIHTYETLITEYEKSNLFDPLEGWFVDGETKTFEDLINILSSKEDYCDIAYNNDNMTITRIK